MSIFISCLVSMAIIYMIVTLTFRTHFALKIQKHWNCYVYAVCMYTIYKDSESADQLPPYPTMIMACMSFPSLVFNPRYWPVTKTVEALDYFPPWMNTPGAPQLEEVPAVENLMELRIFLNEKYGIPLHP